MEPLTNPSSRLVHRDRNVMAVLLAIIGFFLAWSVLLAMNQRGLIILSVQAATLLLVLLAPISLIVVLYGWAALVDAFLWMARPPNSNNAAGDAVTLFQLAATFSLAAGFLGTLGGLIVMLASLDLPRQLGPGLSITLVAQFEGTLLASAYIAAAAHVARRHLGVGALAPLTRRSASVAGVTVIAGTLTTLAAFGILRLAISPAL